MVRISNLYIFTSVLLLYLSQALDNLPQAVIDEMASRETRHHHFLWHNIRNLWLKMDNDTQEEIAKLGWAPPRPSQRYEGSTAIPIEDNDAGEDFLYMHRQMINLVKSIIANQSQPYEIKGWESIPAPNDTDYPVPPLYNGSGLTSSLRNQKSDDFYYNKIKPKEDQLKDPTYLRRVTLGELGTQIEFTIHSWLHLRFSEECSVGYRYRDKSVPIPDIDTKWDDPEYTWLVDTYASHVHPVFWKLHGWVDGRIEDWRRANNVEEIEWKGTWEGGPMSMLANLLEVGENVYLRGSSREIPPGAPNSENSDSNPDNKVKQVDVMDELTKILLKTGMETSFSDEVVFEDNLPA